MTAFEQKGMEIQMACDTVDEAVKKFAYSCNVCCTRGIRLSCDHCAIAVTHEQLCAAIRDAEEVCRQKEVERAKLQKRMSSSFSANL